MSGSSGSREEGEVREELSYEEERIGEDEGNVQEPAEEFLRFEWSRSSKGKDLLRRDGYEYTFEANSKENDGIEYWRCQHRPPYCPGRLHVQSEWQNEGGKRYKLGKQAGRDHNHPARSEAIRDAQMNLREHSLAENPLPVRAAVSQARQQIPVDVRAQGATSSSSMGRTYRNYVYEARRQQGDDQLDALEPVIPDRYNGITLFDGEVDEHRMLIFCSDFGKHLLGNYGEHIAIDGTFKSCPGTFTQLYTVNVIIDSCSIPAIYALLDTKNRNTYGRLSEEIRNAVHGFAPNSVMADFEIGAMEAIREIYPQITVVGCLFHFGQSIYRQLQKLPLLFSLFRDAEQEPHQTRTKIKSIISLAFVPVPYIYNFFCLLMFQFEQNEETLKLIKYFAKNWIGCNQIWQTAPLPLEDDDDFGAYGQIDHMIRNWIQQKNFRNRRATFRPEIWNMCDRIETNLCRTNNSLEAWHKVWNANYRGHPRLSQFMREMIKEDNHWRVVVEDYVNSPANGIRGKSQKRRAEYVEQDANLRQIFEDRVNRQPLDYLRAISYRMPEPL